MIVYNLCCDQDHPFEGWFGSPEDLAAQQARGLLACPLCGSATVHKMLSAPRLNLMSARERSSERAHEHANAHANENASESSNALGTAPVAADAMATAMITPQHAKLLEMMREIAANTEDVGQNFPEEARRIHYQEAPARSIRGFASKQEAAALAEEGIEVAQLPFALRPKNALN